MGIEKIFGSKRLKPLLVLCTIPIDDVDYFPNGRNSAYDFESNP